MGSNLVHEPKRRFPADEERAYRERMHRHRHNGYLGSNRQALVYVHGLANSPSATPAAKELAAKVAPLLQLLGEELYRNRVELDGSVVQPKHEGELALQLLREYGRR